MGGGEVVDLGGGGGYDGGEQRQERDRDIRHCGVKKGCSGSGSGPRQA